MSTQASPAPPVDDGVSKLVTVVGVVISVALAVNVAYSLTTGAPTAYLVLPIALAVGAALAYVASTRFEAFVLFALVIRSSLDAAKLGRGTGAFDPASMLSLLFLLASLVWILAQRRAGVCAPESRLRTPILAFLFACLLSVLTSLRPGSSIVELLRLTSVGVMYLVLDRLLVSSRKVRNLLAAVFASSVVPVLSSALAAASGNPLTDGRTELEGGISRVSATFNQANGFSRYLLFLILMLVALLPHLPRAWKLVGYGALASYGTLMILTYTRSSWLGVVIGFVVIGILQSKKLLIAMLVGAVLLVSLVPSVAGRFGDLLGGDEVPTTASSTGEDSNSVAWRFGYWAEVMGLAKQNPVTGIGLKVTEQMTEQEKAPHNDFLRAYVEVGIIGFIAYLALLVGFVRTARYGLRWARPGWQRGVAVGFSACATAFIFVSVASNVISQVVLLWYFLAFAAACMAVGRLGRQAAERSAGEGASLPPAVVAT